MKKILIPAFAIIAFAACQKTTKVTPVNPTASITTASTANDLSHEAKANPNGYLVFKRTQGSYSCDGPGGNCTATVIIRGGAIIVGNPTGNGAVLSNLIDATRIQDNTGIIKLFTANRDLLLTYIDIDTYTNVVNGTYAVTSVVNNDNISNFIIFDNISTKTTMLVLPVTLN